MKGSTIAKTLTIAAVTALALSVPPTAKAQDRGCSNVTLRGTYIQNYTGFNVSGSSITPVAAVLALTFQGNGVVTAAGAAAQNGDIANPATQTGTYTVNPDCTGSYTVTGVVSGHTFHFFFVIGDDGNELRAISTDPGKVYSGGGRKLFPGRAI
jgi:hypothetical protein